MALFMIATGYSQVILINGKVSTMSDLQKYQIKNDTITIKKDDSMAKTFETLDVRIDDYSIIFPKEKKKTKKFGSYSSQQITKSGLNIWSTKKSSLAL